MIELIQKSASRNSRSFITDGSRKFTYPEMLKVISAYRRFFLKRGIKKGSRVGIYLLNNVDFVISFFALSSIGAVSVLLSRGLKSVDLRSCLKEGRVEFFVTDKESFEEVTASLEHEIDNFIILEKDKIESSIDSNPCDSHIFEYRSEDKILCLFSTGSTGRPKCVSRTRANLLALAANHTHTVGWKKEDKILLVIPLSHTYGFGNFISAVKAGVSIYLLDTFRRKEVLDVIEKKNITIFPAVPFMLDILTKTRFSGSRSLSSLRHVFSAGAPLGSRTFFRFYEIFGLYPRQLYGSSETGVISVNMSNDPWLLQHSVGKPVKDVEVKVVGEDGRIMPSGEIGEIIVKSPSMTSGYENMEEETKKVFKHGFYYTGDLGYVDEEGYIFLEGRKKFLINISGQKVDPVEIEEFLLTHEAIVDVAVKEGRDGFGNKCIEAHVVSQKPLSVSEIVEYCRGKISDVKVPKVIRFKQSIPRSETGKVLRSKL